MLIENETLITKITKPDNKTTRDFAFNRKELMRDYFGVVSYSMLPVISSIRDNPYPLTLTLYMLYSLLY